jgi:RNA polymerase sigma-70 factor (ECF subfamily)
MNHLLSRGYTQVYGIWRGEVGLEILRAIETREISSHHEFAELVDAYGSAVYKFCRSLAYSKEDADDLFQETFMRVLEQPSKIEMSESPQSFLFSTTLYIWKSWKRKYARRNRIAHVEPLYEIAANGGDLEESAIEREETRIVREMVEALPEKFRIPIILYYTMEMSVADAAQALKLPVGTVKSRLFKARKLVEKGLVDVL